MPLGLFPQETQDLLSGGLGTGTTPPPKPGFFAGALDSIGTGFEEGAAKVLFALPPMRSQVPIGMNLPESAYSKDKIPDAEYATQLANDTTAALKSFQPDPHVVGTAGQTLFGLASGLTRIAGGAAIAGPVGGAIAVGGSEGVATTRELEAGGVDPNTAQALGAGAALFSGAGALLPGGVGKTLLERVTTGAYGQFGLGMLNRGLMHNVLDEAGYHDMAKAYQPLDGAAMMSDIVLGLGFGVTHNYFENVKARKEAQRQALIEALKNLKPSDLDAAHAIKDAQHVEDAAGGPAADPVSRTNLIDNQTAAAEKIVSGDETPPESKDVRVVPDPAQERSREASALAVEEAGREAGAERVELPVQEIEAFHGTLLPFGDEYRPGGSIGPHFGTLEQASKFAEGEGGNIRPVILSLRNMLRLADHGWENPNSLVTKLVEAGVLSEKEAGELAPLKGRGYTWDETHDALRAIKQKLIDKGYDSIVYKNETEGAGDSYIALKPEIQVRSKFAPEGSKLSRADRAAKAEAETAATLDPATAEAVGHAEEALSRLGDLKIENDAGETVSATDALRRALDDIKQAQGDGELHRVAAACFGRG